MAGPGYQFKAATKPPWSLLDLPNEVLALIVNEVILQSDQDVAHAMDKLDATDAESEGRLRCVKAAPGFVARHQSRGISAALTPLSLRATTSFFRTMVSQALSAHGWKLVHIKHAIRDLRAEARVYLLEVMYQERRAERMRELQILDAQQEEAKARLRSLGYRL